MSSSQGGSSNNNDKKGKGKYTGKTTEKKRKEGTGGKLRIAFDEGTNRAIGDNHGTWGHDLGYLARTYLPVRWDKPFNKLDEKVKAPIYKGMLERYHFTMTSEIKKAMDSHMASLHRDWRCQLHQHFKNVGGYVNLQVAKSHPHPDIIENEDWQWLCDYWSAKEQKELGERNALNRAARNNYNSSHGSKSFAAHRQGLVDPNTSQFLGDIEFHRLMYTNHQTGRWCDPQAEKDYNDMLALRDSQSQNSDVESTGQSQQVLTEEEIVQKVRKPRPGYIKGRGRIVKGSSSSGGGQLENAEVQELKNKVATYEAQVSTYKNEVSTYQNQVSTYQNQLATCTAYIQQLTAQLNMQFPGQFNQLDPSALFPPPPPPQYPPDSSRHDDNDDDDYYPEMPRNPH